MLKQAVSESAIKRFEDTAKIFRKYAAKYDTDYLLMMAKGFQESGLNQAAKSPVGAIGVMQLMPETGAEMKVGDIHQEEPNIHAGVKYFYTMMQERYGNEPMDTLNKILFTFASYNCGPNRVRKLRKEAAATGLDPNVWINNVEVIAAARWRGDSELRLKHLQILCRVQAHRCAEGAERQSQGITPEEALLTRFRDNESRFASEYLRRAR